MTRVAIVTLMRPTGHTGVQTHTHVLAEGLRAAGLSCTVVTPFGSAMWLPVFAVRRAGLAWLNSSLGTRWYRHWHAAALRASLRRTTDIDVVIAQDPLSAAVALELRGDAGRHEIVLVCHFNTSQADEFRAKGDLDAHRAYRQILELERDVFARVDRVIYVSEWSRREIEETRGIRTRASYVIHNGLPEVAPSTVTRAELGLGSDDLVLVNVGTLEPRKNQLGLVELHARILVDHPRARLVIIGDGPSRVAVTRAARALGDRVVLLGGRNDAADILALADVYVHLARSENLPLALIEAARAGLPIAAAPVGGIAELVHHLGIVALDSDDAEASVEQLRRVLLDTAYRREIGVRCRRGYERAFTQEAMLSGYLEVVEPATEPFGVVPPSS